MEQDYFGLLPESILLKILQGIDFEAILASRATCRLWNQVISSEGILAGIVLNLRADSSKEFHQFKIKKWNPSIMGPWEELCVLMSGTKSDLHTTSRFPWGSSSPFKVYFPSVKKLTIVEDGTGSCSVLDLVHSMACAMPSLMQVCITEFNWHRGYPSLKSLGLLSGVHKLRKSWRRGMKRIKNLQSIRIAVFSRLTTEIYLNLFIMACPTLVTIDIDLSKNYGLPFESLTVYNMYQLISKLILRCKDTLNNLRIKWDHRAEEDADLIQHSQDSDPFVEFLKMVGSNTEDFTSLKLKILFLGFPSISFFSAMAFEVLIPFLKSQDGTLQQVHLSRCKWDLALQRFNSRFNGVMQRKIEYTVYMLDLHEMDHQFQNNRPFLLNTVRGVDFHSVCTERFTMHSLNVKKRTSRRTGRLKWTRHSSMNSFKLFNSGSNVLFQGLRLREILQTFRHLQELELIDGSGVGHEFNNLEFNTIFVQLTRLKSLKMSNLAGITDGGICCIADEEVRRMRDVVGVVYPSVDKNLIPITQAKCLKYVELRDLSANVSDVSVFLAFQHIPKLEKIGFHGTHQISEWGHAVLFRRFKRNPIFAIYFQATRKPIKPYLLDFP